MEYWTNDGLQQQAMGLMGATTRHAHCSSCTLVHGETDECSPQSVPTVFAERIIEDMKAVNAVGL